jgi:hypothetical protein
MHPLEAASGPEMKAPLTVFLLVRGVEVGRGGVEPPTFRFQKWQPPCGNPVDQGQTVPNVRPWCCLLAVKVAVTKRRRQCSCRPQPVRGARSRERRARCDRPFHANDCPRLRGLGTARPSLQARLTRLTDCASPLRPELPADPPRHALSHVMTCASGSEHQPSCADVAVLACCTGQPSGWDFERRASPRQWCGYWFSS